MRSFIFFICVITVQICLSEPSSIEPSHQAVKKSKKHRKSSPVLADTAQSFRSKLIDATAKILPRSIPFSAFHVAIIAAMTAVLHQMGAPLGLSAALTLAPTIAKMTAKYIFTAVPTDPGVQRAFLDIRNQTDRAELEEVIRGFIGTAVLVLMLKHGADSFISKIEQSHDGIIRKLIETFGERTIKLAKFASDNGWV